jgi:hypothetical protein
LKKDRHLLAIGNGNTDSQRRPAEPFRGLGQRAAEAQSEKSPPCIQAKRSWRERGFGD